MSTSLLYHGWSIRGYQYRRTRYENGTIVFDVEPSEKKVCCSRCGTQDVVRQGTVTRRWRTLPIGGRSVFVQLDVPRVRCSQCKVTRQIKIDFADERVHHCKAFTRYVLELSQHMSIQDVADHLGVGWDVVKGIVKGDLKARYRHIRLKDLKQIAVDEISIGKGHRYITLVLDLESGAVVFIGNGKGADALEPFWARLIASRAKIDAVASDMSAAYLLAISENLPKATHVLDRFHVMKLYNEKLADLRRDVQRTVETVEHKELIKGTRWLLAKNEEDLDPDRNEYQRLQDALRINQPLATAYYLKEDLRQFWERSSKRSGERFLDSWIAQAESSGIKMLIAFAKTLRLHRRMLLNWYDYPISTGPLEGTNNKIKTMKRQAYGYRDQEFFRLKIYSLHEKKHAKAG